MKRRSVMASVSMALPSGRGWQALISATGGRVRPSRPLSLSCMVLALFLGLLTAQGTMLEATSSSRPPAPFMPAIVMSSPWAGGLGGMQGLLLSLGFGLVGLWCWPRGQGTYVPSQEQSLAAYDHVTGLPTIRLFNVLLEQAFVQASRLGRSVGVLVVELSQFRPDPTAGAPLSETLVARVQAARIKSALQSRDTVAHLGDRRFAVLMDTVLSAEQIIACASHIQHTLALPLLVAGQEVFLSCRIGSAMLSPEIVSGEALLTEAVKSLGLATSEDSIHFSGTSVPKGPGASSLAVDRHVPSDSIQG